MTIAREGLREMSLSTAVIAAIVGGLAWLTHSHGPLFWILVLPLFGVWVFTILFFRDPHRNIPADQGLLVAPADGKVTEVTRLDQYPGIEGPALKISIFLSVFDVHINRTPCAGRVTNINYRPGQFLDARHPQCGILNEANEITIAPDNAVPGPVIVRQVAGLIARRIICHLREGEAVKKGQRFGLIKFGSRTDVILPADGSIESLVQVNDKVRGGSTKLIRVNAKHSAQPRPTSLSPAGSAA